MVAAAWGVLLAPAAACACIIGFARRSRPWSAALAIGGMAVSFLCAAALLLHLTGPGAHGPIESALSWVRLAGLHLEFGLLVNVPAVLMSGVVTGVGLLIFIYSTGYMAADPGWSRYFASLSGFAFSMLGIVLADNFVTLFIFWELVGASSYLLIGHWYERPAAADAGKKAFLVNRLADFGFLIGILMLWNLSGAEGHARTLNFQVLHERLSAWTAHGAIEPGILAVVGGLIFCGVLGKSAQFPLHVWLPDAMEGPTPVSALIHAATMVAAGVYLLVRTFFLFASSAELMGWIAGIGGLTAFFAATLALVENDIKRILAYSTLSQLGYMVMAIGLGGAIAGFYHLSTHAFFKALLFMGAGAVIHALHTNDIWKMGGLLRKMPVTSATFLIATLALAGIFPLSGFWSKDEILAVAWGSNRFLWGVGTVSAFLTAFYMGRLVTVAFLGAARCAEAEHAHEAPRVMTVPLGVLALLSAAGGFLGIPALLHHAHLGGAHPEFNLAVALVSTLSAVAGLAFAYAVYGKGWRPPVRLRKASAGVAELLRRKYFVDELYGWINRNVQQRLAILAQLFERWIIIGLMVNGTAWITRAAGRGLRRLQTGKVQSYALALVAGFTLFLYWVRR